MATQELLVIVDCSGSMQELGKSLLARNLVSFIREFTQPPLGTRIAAMRLFHWHDSIIPVALQECSDVPSLPPGKKADLDQLKVLFTLELDNDEHVRAILLSDGNFSRDQLKSFGIWRREHPHLILQPVAIGSDSWMTALKELSSSDRVYNPEDIAAAINSIFFTPGLNSLDPFSVRDLQVDGASRERYPIEG
jgi:hypothetical protein